MQNFLFRKNSHSASVVAKALPRPPESPPSPSPAPVRGSGSVSRIRRTAGGSPHRTDRLPQRPGYPKNSGERMHESRSAGTQTARGTGGTHPDKPVCPCAGGRNRRIRRYAKVRRTYGPTGPRKGFDGSPRNADRTPPNRPANRSAADECYRRRQKIRPLDRVHRAGATVLPLVCRAAAAKRPTAPYSARGRRQRRRAAKPAQSDVCANLLRGPDKKTSGPIRTPRPARHRAGYDTHPIHGRLRTPGKPAQAATSPAQRASGTETTCRTQRNSSPTTSLSPTSSHAESALTAPRRTPSARSAATNRTTRSVPSAPQPRRLQCPQPCRIQRSQPPGRIRRP